MFGCCRQLLQQICEKAQGKVLKFVQNGNLTILDPIWTTAYVTRNHGYFIYDSTWPRSTLHGRDDITVIGVPPPGGDRTNWTPPQMHVPVNETVELQMHATDVIHSFYVPAFLYQRDITPRKDQVLQFLADREGTYRGQCTQFCGLLHQAMEFDVVVESRDAFNAWLTEELTPPPTPTPAPSTSAAPGASQEPGATVSLAITASGIAFDTDSLEVPANTPFQIVFTNNDAGIPHNVAIHEGSPTGPAVWTGEIFNGVETRTYDVPALPAGTYGFVCTVHPNMTGTLTAR